LTFSTVRGDGLDEAGGLRRQPERDRQPAVVEPEAAVVGLLRHGDRGQVEDRGLERRPDGAGVGDVVADVQAVVDPRHDEVDRGHEAGQGADPHAVDGRSRAGEHGVALAAAGGDHADGAVERDRAGHAAAVAIRGDHGDLQPELEQLPTEGDQPLGGDPVVVRQEHVRHGGAREFPAPGRAPQVVRPRDIPPVPNLGRIR
jgi:hypothetical protein